MLHIGVDSNNSQIKLKWSKYNLFQNNFAGQKIWNEFAGIRGIKGEFRVQYKLGSNERA